MENGLLALIKFSRDPKRYKEEKITNAIEDEDIDTLAGTIFTTDKVHLSLYEKYTFLVSVGRLPVACLMHKTRANI